MTFRMNAWPLRAWLLAGFAALALAGCGGGGDGGTTTNPDGIKILDSFGREVAAGGADGVGVGDAGSDGTAGEGKPIVGGVVRITDVNGKTVSATTDAQGYYRAKVTGFTPPFVASVTKTDGKVLTSLNVKAIKTNGFITLNLSGLTDKVASDVAKAGGQLGASKLTPQIVAANQGAISDSLTQLRSQIRSVITASGIDVDSFDPLSVPFVANSTGYDKVLDNVVVTVGSDGQTQVAVSPTFTGGSGGTGALPGTWTYSFQGTATAGDASDVPQAAPVDVPGSAVPKDLAAASDICGTGFTQAAQPGVGAEGGTLTCSGNRAVATFPDGTVTIVFNAVSYQGCGDCGVGSRVVVNVTGTATVSSGGSTDNVSFSGTNTYVRKN